MNTTRRLTGLLLLTAVCGCESTTHSAGNRIVSVAFETSAITISQAETQRLAPTIRDADGNVFEDVAGISWKSANPSVVVVSNGGEVTGRALGGPVDITVTAGGKSATAAVTVIPHRIDITPETPTLALGQPRQLTGIARDFNDGAISGAGVITWSSTDQNVATVSAGGLVNPVAAGTTSILATIAGRTGQLDLEVGTASPHDGHWTGTSTSPGAGGPRISPIEFDVVFGTVREFRLMFVQANGSCSHTFFAASQGNTPVGNNAFQVLVFPNGTGQPVAFAGTFSSNTEMSGTHPAVPLGTFSCGAESVSGALEPGTMAAVRGG